MKSPTTLLKKRLLALVLIWGKIKLVNIEWLWYCITCSKYWHRTTMNWWHFIPQAKWDACKFELDNINLQCSSCNGQGNQWEQYKHWLWIDSNYYKGRADELHDQSRILKKRKIQEIEKKIIEVEKLILTRYYKQTIKQQKILVEYMRKNTERKSACRIILTIIANNPSWEPHLKSK